jgi:hypothetical protein
MEQSAASIAAELAHVRVQTVISAHTHVQVDRHVRVERDAAEDFFPDPTLDSLQGSIAAERHWHVINPGSVGLPLNGDPAAQFAIITNVPESEVPGGWQATHHHVAYDRRPSLEAFATSGMAAAGGVISQLFYWELVTAESEIIYFYQWARSQGYDANQDMLGTFHAYREQTGRDAYVRARDPLYQRGIS